VEILCWSIGITTYLLGCGVVVGLFGQDFWEDRERNQPGQVCIMLFWPIIILPFLGMMSVSWTKMLIVWIRKPPEIQNFGTEENLKKIKASNVRNIPL
jgi:hypothetical protein